MSAASIRTILPLSLITGTSMLAMDLYCGGRGDGDCTECGAHCAAPVAGAGLCGAIRLWRHFAQRALCAAGAVCLGNPLHVFLYAALLAGTLVGSVPFAAIAIFWAGFCGALAVRGPPTFSDALSVPPSQMGRASAMLILALLAIGSVGTQLIAPFMAGTSVAPIAAAMLAMLIASAALVTPYPKAAPQNSSPAHHEP